MKFRIFFVAVLLAGFAFEATANCENNTRLNANKIRDELSGWSITAVGDGDEWKEDHCANGSLYKVGDPDNQAVDPRAKKGTWSIDEIQGKGNAVVTYLYRSGDKTAGPYSFQVHQAKNGGPLYFCDESGRVVATVINRGGLTGGCE